MKNGFFLCCAILIAGSLRAQKLSDELFIRPIRLGAPLDGELYINATFGEPRFNHFHSGLDLKTHGQINKTVRSAEKGYVSRIKVSATGYGRALYINHPSGLTTVYAHLHHFVPAIDAWVKAVQYQNKSFTLDTIYRTKDSHLKRDNRLLILEIQGAVAALICILK